MHRIVSINNGKKRWLKTVYLFFKFTI